MNMIYQKNRFSPQNKTSASLKLLTTASTLALVGCGGGSGGSSFFVPGSGSSIGSSTGSAVAGRLSLASRIVDGYVADAQVFPDFDFDGIMDADEAVFAVRSDSQGNVLLDLPSDRSYQLVSRGGTDINTGNEISTLIAAPGSAVVSPFTSMAASLMSAASLRSAAARVNASRSASATSAAFDSVAVLAAASACWGRPLAPRLAEFCVTAG